MLKKTITFDDLDGNQVTEDFYFNLTKAEMVEMSVGGFQEVLQKILDSKDTAEMLKTIRELVGRAVGKRSADGRSFIKNDEITQGFIHSEAFSELFMELVTDEDGKKSTEFFMGLMPKGITEQAKQPVATILPVDPPKMSNPLDGLAKADLDKLVEEHLKRTQG